MIESTKEIQTTHHSVHDIIDIQEVELVTSQLGYKDLFDNMLNERAYSTVYLLKPHY